MNILLIGSGGREHALAWKLAQSPQCDTLFCAPGNPGIAKHAHCIDLKTDDHGAVIDFCTANDIAYVVVGPEAPLVAGLVDDLAEAGIDAFGPSAAAAQLEGSKGFTKDLCAQYNIPTARYRRFDNAKNARAFLSELGLPAVIKADGLAAGKGVTIAQTRQDAEAAIEACFDGSFGKAGHEVVLEAFLEGEEASLFAICDGKTALLMGTAQDHKCAYDGDKGPNTGGMGAYSPAPVMSQELIDQTMSDIIVPTLAGMAARGAPFKGVLYAGLMITEKGPELIEYNVRFGDPECQVLMTRLKSDLVELMQASTSGSMLEVDADWHDEAAMTIVMAANGYPGNYEKGSAIRNIDQAEAKGTLVFHAGTRMGENGIEANGGRVLNITSLGKTVTDARNTAYAAIDKIDWSDGFYRKDIGWRAIERENQ